MAKTTVIGLEKNSFSLSKQQTNMGLNKDQLRTFFILAGFLFFSTLIFGSIVRSTFSLNKTGLNLQNKIRTVTQFNRVDNATHVNCNSLIYSQNEMDVTFSESEDDDESSSKHLLFYSNNSSRLTQKFQSEIVKHLVNESSTFIFSNLYILFLVFRI